MAVRRKKDPINDKESDKLLQLYEDRAKVERALFMVETLLKFLPASILTVFISLFYVGNQDISYWGIHVTIYVMIILMVIIIFAIILFIKSSKLYKKKYPIIRDIELIRRYEDDKVIVSLKQDIERKFNEVERKRLDEERAKIEQKKKLEREKEETEIIFQLDRIINGLERDDDIDLQTESHKFRWLCFNDSIKMTDNPEIIDRIKTCIVKIFIISYTGALEHLIEGFQHLVIEAPKCTYLNLAKDKFYQEIKTVINNENNYEHKYMESMYQIFCNIAKLEDIDSILMPHKAIKDKSKIVMFKYITVESIFLITYKDELIRKIVDILKKEEKYNKRNMEELRALVIEEDIESTRVCQSNCVNGS